MHAFRHVWEYIENDNHCAKCTIWRFYTIMYGVHQSYTDRYKYPYIRVSDGAWVMIRQDVAYVVTTADLCNVYLMPADR